MPRKTLITLTCVLAVVAAACTASEPPAPVTGGGKRFVPQVVDSIADVGVSPSVVTDVDGNPYISYLGFGSNPAPGEIPETRPVTLPLVPAVMFADQQGEAPHRYWNVGGIEEQNDRLVTKEGDKVVPIPNAETDAALDSTGALNVIWTQTDGLRFAVGVGGAFESEPVARGDDIHGVSLAIGDGDEPWVSYYSRGTLFVATRQNGRWSSVSVAETGDCGKDCPITRSAIAFADGPIVAYTDGKRPLIARPETTDEVPVWSTDAIAGDGGFAISMAANDKDVSVAYLTEDGTVQVASLEAGGAQPIPVGKTEKSPTTWLTTGVAVDDQGQMYVTWYDAAADAVRLASVGGGQPTTITTPGTAHGAAPSISASPDGAAVWVAWYDHANGNLQAGMYGLQEVTLAMSSPSPVAAVAAPPPASTAPAAPMAPGEPAAPAPTEPAPPSGGGGGTGKPVTLTIAAPVGSITSGFDKKTLSAPAGSPIVIEFDNQDTGVPHNVEIMTADPADDPNAETLFLGETITGPAQATYQVPSLDEGTYFYRCTVHPTTMTGTLTIK